MAKKFILIALVGCLASIRAASLPSIHSFLIQEKFSNVKYHVYPVIEKILNMTFTDMSDVLGSGINSISLQVFDISIDKFSMPGESKQVDFPGIDPEVNLTGASQGRGLDYFTNADRFIDVLDRLGVLSGTKKRSGRCN